MIICFMEEMQNHASGSTRFDESAGFFLGLCASR